MNDEAARQGRPATSTSPTPRTIAAAPQRVRGPLLRRRLDALAADVGRLRRRLDDETYDGWLAWRVAEHVDALDAAIGPTAADLYRDRALAGMNEEEAISDALATSDARCAELRSLLAYKTAAR